MPGLCYHCHKRIPHGEVKRCSRCRIITYCSKECQSVNWKQGHKLICTPHHGLTVGGAENPETATIEDPAKKTKEWKMIETGKKLSKWMDEWLKVFMNFEMLALDLANQECPIERLLDYCLQVYVTPNKNPRDKYREFIIMNAKLVALESLEAETLSGTGRGMRRLDPRTGKPDPSIIRLMIALQDPNDTQIRDRCYEFPMADLDRWMAMDKEKSKQNAKTWKERLVQTINVYEDMTPDRALFMFNMAYRC